MKDECYEEVSKSLLRIVGDSKEVTKDEGNICMAVQVEERIAGVTTEMGKKTRQE